MIEPALTAQEIKSCCAALYESDWARQLLGNSFHPGGLALTQRLGELLQLQPGQRVLDVAAGQGHSAIFIARHFNCEVVGIDYSAESVVIASQHARSAGVDRQVCFEQGDAERLPGDDSSFDAVICECAFCTFPDKASAAAEFWRVLRPGGQVGLSDITRRGPLPPELDTLLAWIACLADAHPVEQYAAFLQGAGFTVGHIEPHPDALAGTIRTVQAGLLGVELMVGLNKLKLPGFDLDRGKTLARYAAQAARQGQLGYALITAAA